MTFDNLDNILKKNEIFLREIRRSSYLLGLNISDLSASFLKTIFLRCVCIILTVASVISMYGNYRMIYYNPEKFSVSIEALCTFLQTLITIIKLILWSFTHHKFQKLYKTVEYYKLINDIPILSPDIKFNQNLRKTVQDIIKKCWLMARIQIIFYYVVGIQVASFYFFLPHILNAYNYYKNTIGYVIVFGFPKYFPSTMNSLSWYLAITFTDGCAVFISAMGALFFDNLFVVFVMHGVTLIHINRKIIEFSTAPEVPKNERISILIQSVKHHLRSYEYCLEINDLYSVVALMQMLISLVVLGAVMFQATVGLESSVMILIRVTMYIVAASFQVMTYNVNSQFLTTETEKLNQSWYNTKWYMESKEFKKIVYMMLLRTNRPINLWAWRFTKLSCPTLLSLFQTSGSYFLLLKKVSQ